MKKYLLFPLFIFLSNNTFSQSGDALLKDCWTLKTAEAITVMNGRETSHTSLSRETIFSQHNKNFIGSICVWGRFASMYLPEPNSQPETPNLKGECEWVGDTLKLKTDRGFELQYKVEQQGSYRVLTQTILSSTVVGKAIKYRMVFFKNS